MTRNGYDRYLDYQYSQGGGFFSALFMAIKIADSDNLEKLGRGFPEEVEAFLCWTRIGVEEFAKRLSEKDGGLYEKFRREYGLEGED